MIPLLPDGDGDCTANLRLALKNAGVPTEIHLYAQGKHAFGLRSNGLPITEWPQLVDRWLLTIGMIPAQ